jgi:hypothetical protein
MTGTVLFYRVQPKNGRAYWCPTPRMQELGFEVKALGPDGPEARAEAADLTAKWHEALKEDRANRPRRPRDRAGRPAAAPSGARSYVYFLQVGDRIKIGVSWGPLSRVSSIAGSAHAPISKVVIVPGNRADERRLHRQFERYRSNGEWFEAKAPLAVLIARCAMAGAVLHEGLTGTKTPSKLNRGG